jgi:hypothetical protein
VEYALPKLNICTSLYIIYHFTSISRESYTSKTEHFVLPYIIAYTSSSHNFVLTYIIAYTSCSHILLDNLITFLALHVKVALLKNEYLYFLSSPCVLSRVTDHTSLIWQMILPFLQHFRGDFALPKFELMYFMSTLRVLPIVMGVSCKQELQTKSA